MIPTFQPGNRKIDIEPVIDNLPSAIMVMDRDRRVLLANRIAAAFAQKSKEAFWGLRGGEAFGCVNSGKSPEGCGAAPECEICAIREAIAETFESRRGRIGIETEMEFVQLGEISVRASTNFIESDDQGLVILSLEDMTEHKMQDLIRIENAKLRAAAETAAAICHEMGQPLMAMTGILDLLIMDCEPEDRKLAETVKEQALRLGAISKKLMDLKSYRTKKYSAEGQILDLEASR